MVFAKISWFVNIKIDETGASRFAESFFRTEIAKRTPLASLEIVYDQKWVNSHASWFARVYFWAKKWKILIFI